MNLILQSLRSLCKRIENNLSAKIAKLQKKLSQVEGTANQAAYRASAVKGDISELWNGVESAQTAADNAQTAADNAQSTADNAQSTADQKMNMADPVGTGSFSMNRIGTVGPLSHAEGNMCTASGKFSHAEGTNSVASGVATHAEGFGTNASGAYAHAEGDSTIAASESQHVQGRFNIADSTSSHIVGNGTSNTKRSNAHTLDTKGNAWFAGDVYVGSTSGTNKDDGSKKLATTDEVETTVQEQVPTAVAEYLEENPVTAEVPETLPNPNALIFTGAVEATYDGSQPVSVEIPTGGGSGGGSANWELLYETTLEEDITSFSIDTDMNGEPFEAKALLFYLLMTQTSATNYLRLGFNDGSGVIGAFERTFGVTAAGNTSGVYELITEYAMVDETRVAMITGMTRTNVYNAFTDIRINGAITPQELSAGAIVRFGAASGVTLPAGTIMQAYIKR